MKDHNYQVLKRKNKDEGVVRLSSTKGPKEPVAHMSDIRASEERINARTDKRFDEFEERINAKIDKRFDELKQLIINKK